MVTILSERHINLPICPSVEKVIILTDYQAFEKYITDMHSIYTRIHPLSSTILPLSFCVLPARVCVCAHHRTYISTALSITYIIYTITTN